MSRFILALTVAAALPAQDMPAGAPKLAARAPAAGDRTEIRIESTFDLDIVTRSIQEAEAGSTRQLNFVRTLECSQTVQEAQADGAATYRVVCGAAKLQRSGTNQAPVTEASVIENQSFVVTRTEKGRTVKDANGDPAHADAAGLGAWEDCLKLLPAGEPKEGATWTVDAAAIASFINIPDVPTPTGTFEAKLEKLADGRAVVAFSGTLEGKSVKGFDTKLKIAEGRLVFDLAKGRPVSLTVAGSLEASKDINQKVARPNELRQVDEKVGEVKVTTRKLEVKAEFK